MPCYCRRSHVVRLAVHNHKCQRCNAPTRPIQERHGSKHTHESPPRTSDQRDLSGVGSPHQQDQYRRETVASIHMNYAPERRISRNFAGWNRCYQSKVIQIASSNRRPGHFQESLELHTLVFFFFETAAKKSESLNLTSHGKELQRLVQDNHF